jgi:hypothetical protein
MVAGACGLLLGCSGHGNGSGQEGAGDAGSAPATDGAPTYAPTYTAVYGEVLSQSCALAFCHAGQADYLQITSKDEGYRALVNAPAQGPGCAGLQRVDPGHPETSLLYLKITSPPCGSKMPLLYTGLSGSLDPPQVDQIGQWIEAGALNN